MGKVGRGGGGRGLGKGGGGGGGARRTRDAMHGTGLRWGFQRWRLPWR
jgi:hypothetical protein